jgi:anti-sigma-K factor RskA
MPDTPYLLAAELAFGLLDEGERLEAEQLRDSNDAFAAEVTRWQAIANDWIGELPEHPTSPELWGRVTAAIAPLGADAQVPVLTRRMAAPAAVPGMWRTLAIAASVATCLFAGLWLSHVGRPTPAPTIAAATTGRYSVAQIGGVGDPHLATVLYDRDAGVLTIRIAALAPDPARAPEIWLINGTNPPHSLGFGHSGAATRMKASARLQRSLVGGATLAITLEPVANQPHAAPSSKILGTGTISTL